MQVSRCFYDIFYTILKKKKFFMRSRYHLVVYNNNAYTGEGYNAIKKVWDLLG